MTVIAEAKGTATFNLLEKKQKKIAPSWQVQYSQDKDIDKMPILNELHY